MTKKYRWPARIPTKWPQRLGVEWKETGKEACELGEHASTTHLMLVALTYFPRRMKFNISIIQGRYMAWIEEVKASALFTALPSYPHPMHIHIATVANPHQES